MNCVELLLFGLIAFALRVDVSSLLCTSAEANCISTITEGQCYNEISDLKISTVKIAIMRSRFVIGQLGCSNNPLCMISG